MILMDVILEPESSLEVLTQAIRGRWLVLLVLAVLAAVAVSAALIRRARGADKNARFLVVASRLRLHPARPRRGQKRPAGQVRRDHGRRRGGPEGMKNFSQWARRTCFDVAPGFMLLALGIPLLLVAAVIVLAAVAVWLIVRIVRKRRDK